jgi:hypothetical protein
MAQDPQDAALIECLETAREQLINEILDACGTTNVVVPAERINTINQLLAFLKAK